MDFQAGLIVLIVFVSLFAIWLIFYFIPVGLWFSALVSGVRISLLQLILMRWRKVPPSTIVSSMIESTKAGLELQSITFPKSCSDGQAIVGLQEEEEFLLEMVYHLILTIPYRSGPPRSTNIMSDSNWLRTNLIVCESILTCCKVYEIMQEIRDKSWFSAFFIVISPT